MTETRAAEPPDSPGTAFDTPARGARSATIAQLPFKQAKPKFGGLVEIATDQWAAWTGGEPSGDWTGLKEPNPKSIGPNRYRPSSISSSAKSRYYRIQGLETKFTRDSDLQVFQMKVKKHLKTYGMDTISYISHPTKTNEVVSAIEQNSMEQCTATKSIMTNDMFCDVFKQRLSHLRIGEQG